MAFYRQFSIIFHLFKIKKHKAMKRINLILSFLCLAMLLSVNTFAQKKESYADDKGGGNPNDPSSSNAVAAARDGSYDRVTINEKQQLTYDHIREADVFWEKRVWRVIDTRQKMNQNFGYAKEPFIGILLGLIKEHGKEIRVYTDDEFKIPTSFDEVNKQLGGTDSTFVVDPDTGEGIWKVVQNDFDWATVNRFRVKEDWIFDQEASRMVVRIMGVSPIRDVVDKNTGDIRGTQAMFWAYYPDLRPHLIKKEVFNTGNDSNRLTWDDLFEMRLFSSFIMKESNLQDRRIADYKNGRDQLLESDKVK